MMICKNYFWILLSLFLVTSCINKPDQLPEELKTYFDLKNYFVQQVKVLGDSKVHLQKKIIKDGKTEEKNFNKIDWQSELKPFSDCDINKPAWVHSYSVDTITSKNSMTIKYIARETSLPVQQLKIVFENNRLKQLHVHKQSSNSYYTSKNDYVFEPDSGFTINGSQEVILAEKTNYLIHAKFVK